MNKLSYVSGPSQDPLIYKTIFSALKDAALTWPEITAVISHEQELKFSYAELYQTALTVAQNLSEMGVKKGDRVGIWSPNNVEWLITQYATAAIGAILVNINPAYRLQELEYSLNKVECSLLITAQSYMTSNYLDMIGELSPRLFHSKSSRQKDRLPNLKNIIVIGSDTDKTNKKLANIPSFDQLMVANPNPWTSEDIDRRLAATQPEDPINIQFTSGTTGAPKGATLTHHNILNNGFNVGKKIQLSAGDKICVPVPLYHCFGMVMGNLAAVTHGACVVYPAAGFSPPKTLASITQYGCSALYGVPTMFVTILNELRSSQTDRYDVSSLRTGIMAGSPCPVNTMREVISEMNMNEITICYGMTETSPVSFQSSVSDSLDIRVSTIGTVHPHLEAKVVDQDTGLVLPVGEQGELCTRGYSVMHGYWNDGAITNQVIDAAGWMHTGDLAVFDDAGYARITGRAKDMIIRGGENIYPLEIEEFFRTHPSIEDISIFGVPDKKYGEVVVAWYCVKDGKTVTEDELRKFSMEIAHFKRPRIYKRVDEFPMTVTGKIQKFVMRKMACEELGLMEIDTA